MVAAVVLTFCEVVAVPVRFPVTLPVNVPKKFVAVTAVPVKLPVKTEADNTFVAGLYVRSASAEVAKPLPEDAGEKVIKCDAAVVAATTLTLDAVVAVEELPTNVPKKFVAVAAVPVKLPENTSAVSTFVAGLYCNPASLDNPTPVPVALSENTTE